MKKVILFFLVTFLLSSCVEVQTVSECTTGDTYGFWSGLGHGLVSGIAWFVSLFNEKITVYAVNNNGIWYNLGFLLGIDILVLGTNAMRKK